LSFIVFLADDVIATSLFTNVLSTSTLVVPLTRLSTAGDRAFPVAAAQMKQPVEISHIVILTGVL